jgi:hypothetical protein
MLAQDTLRLPACSPQFPLDGRPDPHQSRRAQEASELRPAPPTARPNKVEGKTFKLVSEYEPAGDQPTAIPPNSSAIGVATKDRCFSASLAGEDVCLMASTSSTACSKLLLAPLAPNKILAAQLYGR